MKHTKGPWSTAGIFNPGPNQTQWIWGPRAEGQQSGEVIARDVRMCDAPLIAAAPELLEACELARKWLANCVPTVEIEGPKPLPILDAAIRKAGGK